MPGLFGLLLVVVVVVMLVPFLVVGCGGDQEKGSEEELPPKLEEVEEVVVRVSGTEGVAYSGAYGSIAGEPRSVDDALGDEPQEYEVEVGEGEAATGGVFAGFQKTEPGAGRLTAQILADGQVVSESTTYAEFGAVNVDWISQMLPPPEEVSPEELPPPPPEEEEKQKEGTSSK
jgi:hypothetical protein